MQNKQLSVSKKVQSIGVHASNDENPESEDEDNSLKASDMKELKHPAKSLYQNELNLEDEIIASEEDYHITFDWLFTSEFGWCLSTSFFHQK